MLGSLPAISIALASLYSVQLHAVGDEVAATARVQELRNLGLDAYYVEDNAHLKVRVGFFASRDAARDRAGEIGAKAGVQGVFAVETPREAVHGLSERLQEKLAGKRKARVPDGPLAEGVLPQLTNYLIVYSRLAGEAHSPSLIEAFLWDTNTGDEKEVFIATRETSNVQRAYVLYWVGAYYSVVQLAESETVHVQGLCDLTSGASRFVCIERSRKGALYAEKVWDVVGWNETAKTYKVLGVVPLSIMDAGAQGTPGYAYYADVRLENVDSDPHREIVARERDVDPAASRIYDWDGDHLALVMDPNLLVRAADNKAMGETQVAEALHGLARYHQSEGNLERASAAWRSIVLKTPNTTQARVAQEALGGIAERRRRAEMRNGIGWQLLSNGAPDEAIVEFRRALDADPGYAPALYNLACALARSGDNLGSLVYLRRVLTIDRQTYQAKVAAEKDFSAIRDRSEFQALMRASL